MSILFLAKGPLDEVAKEKDVEIEWMPFELRPSPYSKIDPWNEPEKKVHGMLSFFRQRRS